MGVHVGRNFKSKGQVNFYLSISISPYIAKLKAFALAYNRESRSTAAKWGGKISR